MNSALHPQHFEQWYQLRPTFTDVLSPGREREFSLSMDEGFDSDEVSDRDSSDEGLHQFYLLFAQFQFVFQNAWLV